MLGLETQQRKSSRPTLLLTVNGDHLPDLPPVAAMRRLCAHFSHENCENFERILSRGSAANEQNECAGGLVFCSSATRCPAAPLLKPCKPALSEGAHPGGSPPRKHVTILQGPPAGHLQGISRWQGGLHGAECTLSEQNTASTGKKKRRLPEAMAAVLG